MEDRDWDAEVNDALSDEHVENEPTEEEYAELMRMQQPALEVIVVGSLDWDEPLVVQAALLGWAQRHAGQRVMLWTTDAPEGAEATARLFAQAQGWEVVTSAPEQLFDVAATVTFGFLVPGAVGSTDLVADLAVRRPVRVFTVESRRPNSRWRSY